MQERLRVIEGANGPCVVKHAPPGASADVLRREHAALAILAHPGVVELVDWTDDARGASLVTRYVGSTSLADLGGLTVDSAVVLGARIAATLGDIHRAGRTHGAIQADHVLLDDAGRPVLCSFGHSRSADAATTPVDVSALGTLLRSMLDRAGASGRSRRGDRVRSAVRTIADAAAAGAVSADEVGARLASLHDADPPPPPSASDSSSNAPGTPRRVERGERGERGGTRTWRGRVQPEAPARVDPNRLITLAIVVVVVVAAAAAAWLGRELGRRPTGSPTVAALAVSGGEATPEPVRTPETQPATSTSIPTSTSSPIATPAPTLSPTSACPLSATDTDIDGDGCGDDIEIRGNLVRAGAEWFRIGEVGDIIAVADWDCSGQATPAMIRRATGEVFVFPVWPEGVEPLDALPIGAVPGANALRRASPATCDTVVVAGPEGAVEVGLEVAS